MNPILNTWNESSLARRGFFVAALLGLMALFAWAVYAVMLPSYQTLFRNLRPQDAATITAELDKQKIKYRLEAGGATILVPESQVHGARIKVLGKDLPLSGTVGFELFNNADLGLTEFAQKVNYQRALQGELARTIMSLDAVESARVHLTLPDSGYLRRATSKPKASVAIALKTGGVLEKAMVRSIQRLVAAAVPDLELADVAVINQAAQGAQAGAAETSTLSTDPRLEQKFEMEEHYVRRIQAQADKLFGVGRTQVNVDLVLNFDQTRLLNESTSSSGTAERTAAEPRAPGEGNILERTFGVESQTSGPASAKSMESTGLPMSKRSSQRRVEEVTVAQGAIRRINVGALVEGRVDKAELERFKALVSSSIGLVAERGDTISVFNTDVPVVNAAVAPGAAIAAEPGTQGAGIEPPSTLMGKSGFVGVQALTLWLLMAALIVLIGWIWSRHVARAPIPGKAAALSPQERERMAQRLSELLQDKVVSP